MCGHGGLLVNVVFSLTGIFHGSAGDMSSGHTWHWGTAEQSHKIPLGKPGLVIPRCETLASRSVTFPLHQRKVQRCTHYPPPPPHPLFLAMRICNWGSRGGKKRMHSKGEGALFTSPRHHHSSKTWLKKKRSAIIPVPLLKLLHRPWDCSNTTRQHIFTVRWETLYCISAPSTVQNRRHAVVCYLVNHAFMSLFKGLW